MIEPYIIILWNHLNFYPQPQNLEELGETITETCSAIQRHVFENMYCKFEQRLYISLANNGTFRKFMKLILLIYYKF